MCSISKLKNCPIHLRSLAVQLTSYCRFDLPDIIRAECLMANMVLSFNATTLTGQTVTVDAAYVDDRLGELSRDEDLSRYIL